jgi:hypothetical protein
MAKLSYFTGEAVIYDGQRREISRLAVIFAGRNNVTKNNSGNRIKQIFTFGENNYLGQKSRERQSFFPKGFHLWSCRLSSN